MLGHQRKSNKHIPTHKPIPGPSVDFQFIPESQEWENKLEGGGRGEQPRAAGEWNGHRNGEQAWEQS